MNKIDKNFYTDNNFNSCDLCEYVYPVNNITIVNRMLEWRHKCQQYLTSINFCSENAIKFGNGTLKT
ncbi:MAG: hypothetical protein ACFFG0_56420 [Candidatus Thorarchaeota archaeon]